MSRSVREIHGFLKNVAGDPRIPARDKKVLVALIALILSPVDLIPDWIPIFGQLDDIVMAALIVDYLFRILSPEILLTHFPWDLKKLAQLRKAASVARWITPEALKRKLWEYSGPTDR